MRNSLRVILAVVLLASLICLSSFIPSVFKCVSLTASEPLKEALFYQKLENNGVRCLLCPNRCFIAQGARGFCGTRQNTGGLLYTLTYAKPVTLTVNDPVEKKPFFHYLPSSITFSVATAGCNLKCKFCQNWEISQRRPEELEYAYLTPKELIEKVKDSGRRVLAYTYNEPTVFYEYMLESAKLAHAAGIKNVMHSNGYINEEPLIELAKYLDAANIDLKGFSDDYYQQISEGSLEPVLKSLKVLRKGGVHLEITNLILPGYNDSEDSLIKMCLWIKDNLGEDVPLHFSRFQPMYKLSNLNPTPVETLEKARAIALDCGLKYVYIGNVPGNTSENTFCPKCKRPIVARSGFTVSGLDIVNGKCRFCGEKISGVWG